MLTRQHKPQAIQLTFRPACRHELGIVVFILICTDADDGITELYGARNLAQPTAQVSRLDTFQLVQVPTVDCIEGGVE